ncbi:MAG TPA: peptide deformylase [Desulfobacteraceae bacterium]|nr:peptide deformylase [Desulfobacteraceae bacterium]
MAENLKIYYYPHSMLREEAKPVDNIDGELQHLIDSMAETMYRAKGIGLAANQVGLLKRIIVFDVNPADKRGDFSVLINPEIVESEGEMVNEEACLSVLEYSAKVKRSAKVKVRGYDRDGREVGIEAENNLLCICLQHEIDHLNGILFIDRISSLKKALYKKRLKKILKRRGNLSNPM